MRNRYLIVALALLVAVSLVWLIVLITVAGGWPAVSSVLRDLGPDHAPPPEKAPPPQPVYMPREIPPAAISPPVVSTEPLPSSVTTRSAPSLELSHFTVSDVGDSTIARGTIRNLTQTPLEMLAVEVDLRGAQENVLATAKGSAVSLMLYPDQRSSFEVRTSRAAGVASAVVRFYQGQQLLNHIRTGR